MTNSGDDTDINPTKIFSLLKILEISFLAPIARRRPISLVLSATLIEVIVNIIIEAITRLILENNKSRRNRINKITS